MIIATAQIQAELTALLVKIELVMRTLSEYRHEAYEYYMDVIGRDIETDLKTVENIRHEIYAKPEHKYAIGVNAHDLIVETINKQFNFNFWNHINGLINRIDSYNHTLSSERNWIKLALNYSDKLNLTLEELNNFHLLINRLDDESLGKYRLGYRLDTEYASTFLETEKPL